MLKQKVCRRQEGCDKQMCWSSCISWERDAKCLVESAKCPRQDLCLDPNCGQTPAHLTESYIKKKLHLQLQSYCSFSLVCMTKRKQPRKIWLENCTSLVGGEECEDDELLCLWFRVRVSLGCQCLALGNCSALQQV